MGEPCTPADPATQIQPDGQFNRGMSHKKTPKLGVKTGAN
jgi:hypothetical protein